MKSLLLTAVLLSVPVMAQAANISPTGYTYVIAPNGTAYFDDTYNGTTGELTDGVKATVSWQGTDGSGATGPNVGWLNVAPTIQFNFSQIYDFTRMTVNMQDGQGASGVGLARSLTVNSLTSPDLVGGSVQAPLDMFMDLTSLAPTDSLLVTVNRNFEWTFLSEFSFEGSSVATVPLPAALWLMIAGLSGMGGLRLVRRSRA